MTRPAGRKPGKGETPGKPDKPVGKNDLPHVAYADDKDPRRWPDMEPLRERAPAFEGPEFEKLDLAAPLLLLPVRLETRADLMANKLRIRIFPDQLNVTRDDHALTRAEIAAGDLFWRHADGADRPHRRAAWQQLAETVGLRRAPHVARRTDPNRKDEAGPPEPRKTPPRPSLTALPQRWIAVGYHLDTLAFVADSKTVKLPLETGLAADPDAITGRVKGLDVTDDNRWLVDYRDARERGMAIDAPLSGTALQALEITTLLVFGVSAGHDRHAAAAVLSDLLDTHSRGEGLGFLPQGAVTNNAPGTRTEWSYSEADTDAELDRLENGTPLDDPDTAAGALRRALGLAEAPALSLAAGSASRERALSRDMMTVLYEPLFGRFLRDLLPPDGTELPADLLVDARDWTIRHVTGGAPYATLRIGAQPYGVLPVAPLPRSVYSLERPKDVAGFVENTVTRLRPEWLRALDQVPLLDPNATDRQSARAEDASDIPAVLASQPHPARLFRRRIEAGGDRTFKEYEARLDKLRTGNPPLHQMYLNRRNAFETAPDIDTQIAVWGRLMLDAGNAMTRPPDWRRQAQEEVADFLALLGAFEQRQRPVKSLETGVFRGALGQELSRYLAARPDDGAEAISAPPLVTRDAVSDRSTPRTWLGELAKLADSGARRDPYKPDPKAPPADLLYQLIRGSLADLSETGAEDVSKALTRLAEVEPATLDRLAREALGLATHRLDAWATGLAHARIEALRDVKEYSGGIAIGAYGWVTDLKLGGDTVSHGFLHAPSLPHAATAAVLRSGWMAHGTTDAKSPAAVDAGSDRIRAAQEILGGLRQGQAVGTLLGYRFERRLRDHPDRLGGMIRDIRLFVLGETGGDATPDEPVDGRALLELFRSGRLEQARPDLLKKGVKAEIERLEAMFDAVHDVALFEATHAATQGQPEHAAAVFEAVNQASQLPPEFRAQRSDRHGTTVEHRLVAILPRQEAGPGSSDGWRPGRRDVFAPDLERWLRACLPPAGHIGFSLGGQHITLDALKLSALDAVYLASEDPSAVSPVFAVLARGGDARQVRADATDRGRAPVSLEEAQLLWTEWRAMLDGASGLDAGGLRRGAVDGAAGALPEDLAKPLDAAIAALEAAGQGQDIAGLARFGLSGGTPEALANRAARIVAEARDRRATAPPDDLLSLLFGRRLPRGTPFTMPDTDAVAFDAGLATPEVRADWLDAVGRVRPAAARPANLRLLGELLGIPGPALHIGQDKRLPGGGWAATARPPARSGGCLSVMALGDASLPSPGTPAVGLTLDQWSERVPATDEITGVTFHYDAPGTRPPQSLLLAMPPRAAKSWRVFDIAAMLFDTLQFAAIRAVQPEDLSDFGAVLPTVSGPGFVLGEPEDQK